MCEVLGCVLGILLLLLSSFTRTPLNLERRVSVSGSGRVGGAKWDIIVKLGIGKQGSTLVDTICCRRQEPAAPLLESLADRLRMLEQPQLPTDPTLNGIVQTLPPEVFQSTCL